MTSVVALLVDTIAVLEKYRVPNYKYLSVNLCILCQQEEIDRMNDMRLGNSPSFTGVPIQSLIGFLIHTVAAEDCIHNALRERGDIQ